MCLIPHLHNMLVWFMLTQLCCSEVNLSIHQRALQKYCKNNILFTELLERKNMISVSEQDDYTIHKSLGKSALHTVCIFLPKQATTFTLSVGRCEDFLYKNTY